MLKLFIKLRNKLLRFVVEQALVKDEKMVYQIVEKRYKKIIERRARRNLVT